MTRTVRYALDLSAPHTHRVEIRMGFVSAVDQPVICLPGWTPGSYLLREFGRHIERVSASVDDSQVAATKVAKASWRLDLEAGQSVEVCYTVYAHDLTVRTAHVDGSHGFLSGTSLFMFVDGELDRDSEVVLSIPDGWATYTTLPCDGEGHYTAPDYDTLVDCPIECGPDHRVFSFEAAGKPHDVVLWGRSNADTERLSADMAKVVEANAALFGDVPYERYLFIVHAVDGGQGGLEHTDSTVLMWQRHRFTGGGHREFMRLVAHEHFHVWNVKRIRPQTLGPFDYVSENYTRALWAMEGITSYYDKRQVLRAGLVTPVEYLEWVAKSVNMLDKVPGREVASLEEASFDAWIKLYRPAENLVNASVSYYLLGSLVALALDLEMRVGTEGAATMDLAMRELWARFADGGPGLPDDDFKAHLIAVGGDHLADWVGRYIERPAQIDWQRHLAGVGLRLERKDGNGELDLGVNWRDGGRLVVANVFNDGINHGAELYPGDEVIAIDGLRADKSGLKELAKLVPEQGTVDLALFRRRELHTVEVAVGREPGAWVIKPIEDASAEQLARREDWLFGALEVADA